MNSFLHNGILGSNVRKNSEKVGESQENGVEAAAWGLEKVRRYSKGFEMFNNPMNGFSTRR